MSIKKLNEAFPKSLKPATRYHQLPQELMFRETIQLDSDLSNNELSPESDLELENEQGLDDGLSFSGEDLFLEPTLGLDLSDDEDLSLAEEALEEALDERLDMRLAVSKLNDMYEEMAEQALEHLVENRKNNRLKL